MRLEEYDRHALGAWVEQLRARYMALGERGLDLDLTRGKPSLAQLELSAAMDGILGGDYRLADGSDSRGYGGLDGIPEAKALAAAWLGVAPGDVLVGGNSSLALMYQFLLSAHLLGLEEPGRAWRHVDGGARCLCPVPGYDRHFMICEALGIDMVPVPMDERGPDMDVVEGLVREDARVRAMWCVPKYSNPTGVVYADEVVRRIAALPRIAPAGFRVLWDNAYAVHDFIEPRAELADIAASCRELGTTEGVVQFGSTSKVTFAGAGIAFMAGGAATMAAFRRHLSVSTIGPDKINQLRHVRFLGDMDGVRAHMRAHAELLRPKFACVERRLRDGLADRGMGAWTEPRGGYFVSVDTLPGLARQIVRMAGEAGVRLTPAGAAFPYGDDPADRNIRLAPSFPPLEEVDQAMEVFVTCVQLASAEQRLAALRAA